MPHPILTKERLMGEMIRGGVPKAQMRRRES